MPHQCHVKARDPVLTTALAVCRVCFPLQDVEALRHVVELLSGYLDSFSPRWTVVRACFAGLPRRALEYLAAHGRDFPWESNDNGAWCIAVKALRMGHLHVLEWINERHSFRSAWGFRCEATLVREAAYYGRLAIVKWLHANRRDGYTAHAMDWAALNGHLDVVRWLHEHRIKECSSFAMDGAAENGHLGVVRFLHENRSEGCTTTAMDSACAYGHLAVVKFLHENRREGCTSEAICQAARNGHLEIVQWLYANRNEGHPSAALESAARCGQAAVVEWLAAVVRNQRGGEDRIRAVALEALKAGRIEVSELLEKMPKRPRLV